MIEQVQPGKKAVLSLPIRPGLSLTVLAARGRSDGPTLLVLGAVHGDEYEGVLAAQDAFRRVSAARLRGNLLAVPVTNLPAFRAMTRSTPEDGLNLARVFPGAADGSLTERIAYHVGRALIARCDFLIDLHSSGTTMTSPTLVGYLADPRSAAAARAFGAPVVWEHPTVAPGRTLSLAAALGIPALYTEARGGMRVRPADLRCYVSGVLNVMGHLGMIDRPAPPRYRHFLWGDGNTDAMPAFTATGLFRPAVQVLQKVRQGEVIGRVTGVDGRTLEEVRANQDGRVVFLRAVPYVVAGERAVLLAEERGR